MPNQTILQTKLYRPRTPQAFVPRPHLVARLNEGMGISGSVFARKLTLVSAPAGYGKSTLLSEWAGQSPLPVAWLSLDATDNEIASFWSHFLAALKTVAPLPEAPALPALQAGQPLDIQPYLAQCINQVAQSAQPVVLILDDYHLVGDPSVHASLAYWLDHCPAQMHLVIATRADPPLPLSLLRGRGQLVELRIADLRFSAPESAAFLNQAMGLNLSPQNLTALERRTEGWIVGLQMAAISLQGRNPQAVAHFVDTFTGSQRFILDYLADEVLLQQPERVQTFLLRTCILDRLTASLCDAVAGQPGSQPILDQLESANLFVIPLDEQRRWYRYHNLFANMLRQRLERSQPEMLPVLSLQASQWCEQNGFVIDALSYAVLSGDASRVATLVARNALVLMEHTELKTLERWLNALPAEALRASPWLNLAQAWLLTTLGKLEDVEPLLQRAQSALEAHAEAPEALRRAIAGHLAALRAYLCGLRGDYRQTIEYARACLVYAPQNDTWMRTWANVTLAFALAHCGQPEEAERKLAEALEISREHGASHVRLLVLNNCASLELSKGRLPQAADIFRQAIQLDQEYTSRTGQHLPIAGYAYTHLAAILCEWNDLEAANEYIKDGMRICESWGEPQLLASGYLRLAEIRAAGKDWIGALDAIARGRQAARGLRIQYASRIAPLQALIHLQSGDLAAARRWADAQALEPDSSMDPSSGLFTGYVLARLEFAEAQPAAALSRLRRLVEAAQSAGDGLSRLRLLALQAAILNSQGKTGQALEALEAALEAAEPGGYMRTFLDLGAPLVQILVQAIASGTSSAYARRLLEAFQHEPQLHAARPGAARTSLEEPLSERELQVLRLLNIHLTRAQISAQLVISENTVRTHLKNIYQKLGVHSRPDAISRAVDLGLLD